MINLFKTIISDFNQEKLPHCFPRLLSSADLPKDIHKAVAYVGMRRSGKTYAMYDRMQSLITSGIQSERFVYVNFEDDRLSVLDSSAFQSILDAWYELFGSKIPDKKPLLFLDEIHAIDGWEKFVRRVIESRSAEVYISGSSAKVLSKEIATSLRGRTWTQEIFPYSFQEYLSVFDLKEQDRAGTRGRARVMELSQNYLRLGGFPETVAMSNTQHRILLQQYIDVVMYRDLIERYSITNVSAVREIIRYCMHNPASRLSVNKLYHRLKSAGISLGNNLIYDVMEYLQDAYCCFSVPLFTHSSSRREVNPKKIYPVDPGLITAFSIKPAFEFSARLESAVFSCIRRSYESIYYHVTKSGFEIDFYMPDAPKKNRLVQVCVTLKNEETRQREIRAVLEAMQELDIKESVIVTENETGEQITQQGKIHIIPFPFWILQYLGS